jgi:hypothetical protein
MIVNGTERADGIAVTKWGVRFTGTHDLETEDAERMALDKVIIFMCAARAGKYEVQVLDDGEVKRKNVATVSDFMILQGELRERAISALANGSDHGLMIFDQPVHSGDASGELADFLTEQIDRLAKLLLAQYPDAFDRSEGAVDMAIRLLDDPRVVGVLNGTLGTITPDGEVTHPTAVETRPAPKTDGQEPLEALPEHETVTDPGWTPADDVDGWDPRDLPEPAPEPEPGAEPEAEAPEPHVEPEPEAEPAVTEAEPPGPPQGEVVGHIKDRSGIKSGPTGGREGPGVGKFDPDTFASAPEGPARGPRPSGGPERVGVAYPHKDPVLAQFFGEDPKP